MATRRSAFDSDPLPDPWELATGSVRDALDERGVARRQQATTGLSFRAWSERLVPEPRGPLDFARLPYLAELYDERAVFDREQVVAKATQVGVSTREIRVALFHADRLQNGVLYTFPTWDELSDYSRKRIRPVLRASDHLRSRMSGDSVDNVGQKQIGANGWVIFRGTNKPIESLDVDLVIFDEYDSSDQANIEATEHRVTGPLSAGLIHRVGVPSIPGFGISARFEASDQRVWTVKCQACGEWNPIRGFEAFQANVDVDRVELVCRRARCRRALDVRAGEWVASCPGRDVRGYHIPKLLVASRQTLAGVVERSRRTKDYQVTAFFTRDLGEPYAPVEGRLSLEQVQACERPELRLEDPVAPAASHQLRVMGVDVASVRALNVVIEEKVGGDPTSDVGRKLWVGEVEDDPVRGPAFMQLCRLMDLFGVHMVGIDHEPEGRMAIALAARYPGRVYRIGFFTPGPQQKRAPAPWTVDDAESFVSLWRTRAYDATFERFRRQAVLLPPLESLPADYAAHLGNLYRQKTELATGAVRVDYVRTGPEDYAQAEAYCLAAIELYWRRVGLGVAAGEGPVPLAEIDDAADLAGEDEDDWSLAGEPVYRAGLE